ncbi:S41 family peptidase [Streptomyces sp. NPDC052396]|uniref:S41 family peptidase n=1 Tax=Streptomyces sp. NPDC052396 TaxID=3365689 RepID=UPI0037D4E5BB
MADGRSGLAAALGLASPATAERHEGGRLDGVWRMNGYGTVLTIHHGRLTAYDTTRVGCLPGRTHAGRLGGPERGGATRFGNDGVAWLTVTPEGRGHADLQPDGSVSTRHLTRISALPEPCRRPAPDDPLTIFDRFWANFNENYPFFAAKGIDWQAVRDRYRPAITPDTSDQQLQQIFTEMLRPLNDAHIALLYHGDPVFNGWRPGTLLPCPYLMDRSTPVIAGQLTGPGREFANGRITVGELPDKIGYLRITSFREYVDNGSYAAEQAELDRALDALFSQAGTGMRGLVVDNRLNSGGSDALGLRIAARLTDRPYLAYTKVARNDPADPRRFTRPQPITVHPATNARRWTGPVALLTGGSTVSAGESFTQALMGRSPQVTRIGENTQGVFSDVLFRVLANDPEKWLVGLPNEEYHDRYGKTYDGTGIPPHLRTPVFTEEELNRHQDSALTRARQLLASDSAKAASEHSK